MSRMASVLIASTRTLFYIGAALWAGVAGALLLGVISVGDVPRLVSTGLAGAMAVSAAAMVFLGSRCLRGRPVIDGMAILLAVGNVVLTFTDQVGVLDLVYLSFAVTLLGMLAAALVVRRRIDSA